MKSALLLLAGFLVLYWAPHLPPDISEVAAAQTVPVQADNVVAIYRSSFTCLSVLVSSATGLGQATPLLSATSPTWASVLVQNKDSAADLYIGDSIFVASGTANGVLNPLTGFEISRSTGSQLFTLVPGMSLYGVNGSGSRQSVATICPGR